jgi:hypothetical protein
MKTCFGSRFRESSRGQGLHTVPQYLRVKALERIAVRSILLCEGFMIFEGNPRGPGGHFGSLCIKTHLMCFGIHVRTLHPYVILRIAESPSNNDRLQSRDKDPEPLCPADRRERPHPDHRVGTSPRRMRTEREGRDLPVVCATSCHTNESGLAS